MDIVIAISILIFVGVLNMCILTELLSSIHKLPFCKVGMLVIGFCIASGALFYLKDKVEYLPLILFFGIPFLRALLTLRFEITNRLYRSSLMFATVPCTILLFSSVLLSGHGHRPDAGRDRTILPAMATPSEGVYSVSPDVAR